MTYAERHRKDKSLKGERKTVGSPSLEVQRSLQSKIYKPVGLGQNTMLTRKDPVSKDRKGQRKG